MSVARPFRLAVAFARLGTTHALAYRTEAFVWLLSTTMPLIMVAFFGAVTREAPIGAYTERRILAYFLATFVVRSLTASWISWQINLEIRDGTLAARLLLPVHPLLAYASESVGAMPVRVLGAAAMSAVMLALVGEGLTRDPVVWLLFAMSVGLAWLLSLLVSATLGALAFFVGSSAKLMDAWLAGLFVFSGYLVPLDLFPPQARSIIAWLPFRYQIGLPVELMIGAHGRCDAAGLLLRQAGYVLVLALAARSTWGRGLARFGAYGG